jgi:hypothetical protein
MKEHIRQLLREGLLGESSDVFKNITNIPDYDKLKDGKYDELPDKYSNMVAEVVDMSPEQYFKYCAEIQKTTYEEQFSYLRKEVVDKIIGLMDNGVKMDMPYLNFVKNDTSQEGRHRAKAAMDMGIKSIPVLVIDNKENEESDGNNTVASKFGVWKDLSANGNNRYHVNYTMDEGDSLLSSIRRSYDDYLLDTIFGMYKYRKLYPDLASTIDNVSDAYRKQISNTIDVESFLGYLPDEYRNKLSIDWDDYTDEEYANYEKVLSEIKPKLVNLVLLFIMEHNDALLRSIVDFDYSNNTMSLFIDGDVSFNGDYSSAKEMLLASDVYDDMDFYNVESADYYNMNKEFINKYIDKV